jgi:hypothetical protein
MARIIVIALLILAWPLSGSAKTINRYSVGGWLVTVHTDDRSGQFTSCISTAHYNSGITLAFSLERDFAWAIGFFDPRWRLTPGNPVTVRYRIDDGLVRETTGYARGTSLIRIALPDDVPLFNEFRRGRTLYVTAGGDVVQFNLTRTSDMLADLHACAKAYREGRVHTASPNMLPRNQPANTKPMGGPAAGPTSESRLEAVTVATNVLAAAGIAGFKFISAEDISPRLQHHDAVWLADNLVGSIRVLAGTRGASANAVKGALLADDSSVCKGKFASAALPMEGNPDGFSLFTACEGQEDWSINHILLPRRKGGHYLFMIMGTANTGEAVKSTGGMFRDAAVRVTSRP